LESPKERNLFDDKGRMGSQWIFGRLAGCCKYGDKPSGSGARELV
jgi:hypothetical protein